ncbi:basic helix-loop-helix and HMG box domain-containing protein 1-like isoform X6 [Anguilla anguilla]|uniref:basic helix-loop-helix and HMG box domain-containing protein 1-like isoform X6 n=1 Tax=Anguilla anguilla TaxID=7936 RepID=UPI0015A9C7E8|nr:basic helix-loop-helix and HMG box domain-containing protein 1-like isoform X6 [Anguilla anguilla]
MDMCSLRRRPWSTCCSIWTSSRATSRACIEGCLLTASHRFKREWGWSTRKENSQPEPLLELETPVCFLKANHKRLCSCPQKRLSLCTGTGGYLGVRTPGDLCSDFWDWTASDDSGSGMLDSSPRSSWSLLLRDHLLDSPVGLGSPPRYGSLPLQAVCDTEEGLNLSPSLLSSPAHGLTHLLPQGQELQALFEDVWVTPKSSSPKVPSLPCISSAEKLYLSYPQVSELDDALRNRGGRVSSLSEGENCKGSDITWTPTQGASPRRGSHIHQCKKALRSRSNLKKKCVNGFIMFCRINRKMYLRTHPGTPSTLVTKELANLWHIMPRQDRCVYCVKARRFSRQQNRNVRNLGTEGEGEGEEGAASPLHMLLAHRDLFAATRGRPCPKNTRTSHAHCTHATC